MFINSNNIEEDIENKLIDQLTLNISGRLVVFKPENSENNLIVEKKGGYGGEKLVLKLNSFIGPSKTDNLTKYFLRDDFKPAKNLLFLFVYFDTIKQKIDDYVWLIPSLDFEKLADKKITPDGKTILVFSSSLDSNKDKFSKFLMKREDLSMTIMNLFPVNKKKAVSNFLKRIHIK